MRSRLQIRETQPVRQIFATCRLRHAHVRKDTRLSPLFRTASDGKLGGAWERGYLYLTLAYHFQVRIHFLHYNNVGRSPWVIYLVSLSVMQLPYICSYQAANYSIEVLEKGTNVSFEEGPFRYVNRDDRIKIQSELRPNWNYTATVIVETVAWSINSSISFSKHS